MFNIMYETTNQLQQWKPLEQQKNGEKSGWIPHEV